MRGGENWFNRCSRHQLPIAPNPLRAQHLLRCHTLKDNSGMTQTRIARKGANFRKAQAQQGSLLAFVKVLNSRLQSNKVSSEKRALLIASILIALERPSFQRSYTSENNSLALAESITSNVSLRLNEAGIDVASVGKLAGHFGVAESENALLGKEN